MCQFLLKKMMRHFLTTIQKKGHQKFVYYLVHVILITFITMSICKCGARRSQRLQLIPSQTQGPRRGGRSVQGRNEGNPNCQNVLPRTTLSSVGQNHGKKAATSPEDIHSRITKKIPSHMGQPQGNRWGGNPRKSYHLRIKYAQLTP